MKLVVADAFTVQGTLVVTGRVRHGVISAGDRLWLLGGDEPVAVVVLDLKQGFCRVEDSGHASAGHNVGLRLGGVEADAVRPGMWLSEDHPDGDRPAPRPLPRH